LTVVALLAPIGFLLMTILIRFQTLSACASSSAVLGAAAGGEAVLAFIGIWVSDSQLIVRNFLSVRTVPISEVIGVSWSSGLRIVTSGGANVGSLAYGSSLIGNLTGNRRSEHVADEINAWIRSSDARVIGQPRASRVNTVLWLIPAMSALYLAAGVAAHAIQ